MAALGGRSLQELVALVDVFIADVVRHFHDEEAIFTAADYPDATAHAELHRALIQKATEIAKSVRAGDISANDLFEFLARDVVTRHMLTADCKFFSYLQAKQ
jgi:hemerythrin-like metal-binding protein